MVLGEVDRVGDTKIRKRFAFFPEEIDGLWVWFEFYLEYSVYTTCVVGKYWRVERKVRLKKLKNRLVV